MNGAVRDVGRKEFMEERGEVMEHTRVFIRELLKLVNMNVGPLKEDMQELYYKADEEMKEVEGKLSE